MIKKTIMLWIFFTLFSISYSAEWTYYQVRDSDYNPSDSYFKNRLYNDSLYSSEYVDKWTWWSWSNTINKIEWNIHVFVVEKWGFQELDWLNVTDYDGTSNYFTATDSNWNDFSSSICSNFDNWYTRISTDANSIYKTITAWWVNRRIKIASKSNDMWLLDNIANIKLGYTNCLDPRNQPLEYTVVYKTQYFYDNTHPNLWTMSYKDQYWNSYSPSYDWWINESITYTIPCVDEPSLYKNSWCRQSQYTNTLNNHQLSTDPLQVTFWDNLNNYWTIYKPIAVPIDKQDPEISSNNIYLDGMHDGFKYNFDKNISNQSILADKYNINLTLKDPWLSCDSTDTNCKWVSWIKKVILTLDWSQVCVKNYSSYNNSYWKKDSHVKNLSCNGIDLTKDKNYVLNLYFQDDAWNYQDITWNINVEPNIPNKDKFEISCLNCPVDNYSTNESNDTYKYEFKLKDYWWNIITKPIDDVLLTQKSHIDKDTYDQDNFDDWNVVEKVNQNLWYWTWSFELRSIVPWNIKDEFKFIIKWYNKFYGSSTDFEIIKDFWGNYDYKKSITTWNVWVENSTWDIVSFTWMVPNTEYVVNFNVNTSGFDDNNYSYEIIEKDLLNSIEIYPNKYYSILSSWNVNGNIKTQWNSSSTISFTLEYEFIWSWAMDKEISLTFNPSIKVIKNWKEGKYSIWTYNYWDESVAKQFNLQILWYKNSDWNTSAIWEATEVDFSKNLYWSNIRKKAFILGNSLSDWEISNWVFYKEWNYNLDQTNYGMLTWEWVKTIIIKDWNLKISTNITERLDIAVISENTNYDMYSNINSYYDYVSNWGNIIIWKDVSVINWLLYTDRSLLAWNLSWDPIDPYSSDRSWLLNKQLIFYGSLISRNTIWGSIQKNWKYTMPWWKLVDSNTYNQKLSLAFDLAFFRVWNEWYNLPLNQKYNYWHDSYILVDYNSDIKLNPYHLTK